MKMLRNLGCVLLLLAVVNVADAAVSTSQLGRILLGANYTSVTRGFTRGKHNGVDFAASGALPVYSPVSGIVRVIDGGRGYLAIEGTGFNGGYTYNFLHMGSFSVAIGSIVTPGTVLGTTGTVAYPRVEPAGPWLHFEVRSGGFWRVPALPSDRSTAVDPANAVNLEVAGVSRIEGPDVVIRGTAAVYRLILQTNDGGTISVANAQWSENSPQAVISQAGRLTVYTRASGVITLKARYAGATVFKNVTVQ